MIFLIIAAASLFEIRCVAETVSDDRLDARPQPPPRLAELIDAPLLFVKRHPYFSGHIYDDYYTWHPGGGIYVLENPSAPKEQQRVRAVIDPFTPESLGEGVYRDPDISWDASRVLFAFKGSKDGDTSIYEIGINGRGLRRVTTPGTACVKACTQQTPVRAFGNGRHDISPCYLPDGRIVFTSTRQASRVPCFNSEVDILHVMNADGSDIHAISVNNVTEFDPAVMPDGRVLYGRWEYVDKTALYMQSLWTCNPDGSDETAFFGNNMAKPTAFLDARPVPGTHLVIASLTPHNGQSVGAIAMIDTRLGKNGLQAVSNFTPEYPTAMGQGLTRGPCDPWPLNADVALIANNATNFPHGVIQIISRNGLREVLHGETNISCFSPMLVKPRPVPPVIPSIVAATNSGKFLVQDIYAGLEGVPRGEIAWLRVLEETSRISGVPAGGRWWNQAFLVSWQGSYTVKNFLGVAPVSEDGSAYFEAPSGRALYFQALDRKGRLVQSMRTFVQASPGATRSCIGCHESKAAAPRTAHDLPMAAKHSPSRLQPESWGSGYVDYPTMIQPILDRHCVECHGGAKGIDGGIDLTGGWTWAFSISYETMLKNTLVGFLNCENESVRTSDLLPPRTHGSGAAPLTALLSEGHGNKIPNLSQNERDLLLAWMDGNCNYYGTWNWSDAATCNAILSAGKALVGVMESAGCVKCHSAQIGSDWINLRQPAMSRILRAPMATSEASGLAWCRKRKARAVLPLVTQSAQPPDVFKPARAAATDTNDTPFATFASSSDPFYQEMLGTIRRSMREALATPRVDMPGAVIHPGECRELVAIPLPQTLPQITADVQVDGAVSLTWARRADLIGLTFEIHRSRFANFSPNEATRLQVTPGFDFLDVAAPEGAQEYAIVIANQRGERTAPARVNVSVPATLPPMAPQDLRAIPRAGEVELEWAETAMPGITYDVCRKLTNAPVEKLNATPIVEPFFTDSEAQEDVLHRYSVRAVSRRGLTSAWSSAVLAAPLPQSRVPVFAAAFETNTVGELAAGRNIPASLFGKARTEDGSLDLRQGGHVMFAHQPEFDSATRISVELRVWMDKPGEIPVLLSCGRYDGPGWFLQSFGGKWRWHVGGLSCDGGEPVLNKWVHLLATYDGRRARLFQDGVEVAVQSGEINHGAWSGPLIVGQYGADAGPKFQVHGRIAGVKIYRRAMPGHEVFSASR